MTAPGLRRRRQRRRMWIERILVICVALALAAGGALVLARDSGQAEPAEAAEGPSPQPTPVAPSTPATPTPTAPRRGSRVHVAAVGDIALLTTPPDNGAGLFSSVDGLLVGDVVLGNLEGTLTERGTSKCDPEDDDGSCFAFRASPEVAPRFADAGFTVLNVANNHSGDFGPTGLQDTLSAVRGAGLEPTGHAGSVAFQTIRRADSVTPTTVAILGFAPYAVANSLLDIEAAEDIVRRADGRADVVVVTMHAGAEGSNRAHVRPGEETYLGERRGDVVAFSKAVVDAGADLVLGHGPHVLRGIEMHRGRMIAYSLGNFATHRGLNVRGSRGVSSVLTVTLAPNGRFVSGRIHPVTIAPSGAPKPGGEAIATIRELSNKDFGAAAPRIGADGSVQPPSG